MKNWPMRLILGSSGEYFFSQTIHLRPSVTVPLICFGYLKSLEPCSVVRRHVKQAAWAGPPSSATPFSTPCMDTPGDGEASGSAESTQRTHPKLRFPRSGAGFQTSHAPLRLCPCGVFCAGACWTEAESAHICPSNREAGKFCNHPASRRKNL